MCFGQCEGTDCYEESGERDLEKGLLLVREEEAITADERVERCVAWINMFALNKVCFIGAL